MTIFVVLQSGGMDLTEYTKVESAWASLVLAEHHVSTLKDKLAERNHFLTDIDKFRRQYMTNNLPPKLPENVILPSLPDSVVTENKESWEAFANASRIWHDKFTEAVYEYIAATQAIPEGIDDVVTASYDDSTFKITEISLNY